MTEENQEQQAIDAVTETGEAEKPIVEGFSDKEIAAIAKGETKVEDVAPATEEPEEEAPVEEVEEAESEENTEEEVVEAAAEEQPKKKNKRVFIPKTRLDEETAKVTRAEAELQAEREKNAKLSSFLGRLAGTKEEEKPAEDDEDEIVDEKAYKKLNGRVDGVEQQMVVRDFVREMKVADKNIVDKYGKEYANASEFIIAVEANKILVKERAKGGKMTDAAAITAAQKALSTEFFEVYQGNGSIEDYTVEQAKALGYDTFIKKTPAKPAEKSKVNMAAVDKARKEAGQPTYKREAVKVAGANWQDELASKAKEQKRFSDKYLQSQGL